MLFRRRKASSFAERVRVALWPRRNLVRSVRYVLLRLKRLPTSPHRIAVGSAAGIFAIFTPFIGVQLLMAAVIAGLLRGSILASFLISFAGNPLTYPVIWFATFNLGAVLLGDTASLHLVDLQSRVGALGDALGNGSPRAIALSVESLWPILKPMAVGSLPLGGFAAAATYVAVHRLVSISRAAAQRRRLDMRAAQVAREGVSAT